jgi:hypothetical protein
MGIECVAGWLTDRCTALFSKLYFFINLKNYNSILKGSKGRGYIFVTDA